MKKVLTLIAIIALIVGVVAFRNRDFVEEAFQVSEMHQSPKFHEAWKHYEAGGGVKIDRELNEEEMEKAYRLFLEIATDQPKNPRPQNYAGIALVYLSRYDEALSTFQESLERKETFTAHYEMAFIYMKKQENKKMVASLREAIEIEESLDSVVRFSTEFSDVRNIPEMSEFQNQYTR